MRSGESAPVVETWVDDFNATMQRIEPRSEAETNAYRQLFVQETARELARRERLLESESIVSPPVWFILGIAGLATVGFVVLFTDRREDFFVQASMIGAVAGLVAASLVLVWFLDHPYRGAQGSIEPTEMERTIEALDHESRGFPLPCNEAGERTAT